MAVERPKIYSGSIGNKHHSKVKPDIRRKYNATKKKGK